MTLRSARWIEMSVVATLFVTLIAPCVAAEPVAEPKASEGVRVALVWIYGDDDAFHSPDASETPSPAAGIGDRAGYDPLLSGYRSRYTGRENRLELCVRGSAPGLVPRLETSAGLALGIDTSSLGEREGGIRGGPLRAEDIGSFVEVRWFLSSPSERGSDVVTPSAGLRLYPIDGDSERVGWLEALGWGGATGPRRESPYEASRGAVRAARAWLDLSPVEVFAGVKTATFAEPVPNAPAIEETSYGIFAGVEARPIDLVTLGVAGGYFEHGLLEGAVRGARAVTAGGSAMASLAREMKEPRSPVSFLGQGDDPFRSSDDAPSGSFSLGVELSALVQRLDDFDRPGQTTLSPARALALSGGARLGRFETSAAFIVRDAEFVMRNAPGVFPNQSVPHAAQRDAERTLLLTNGIVFSELVRVDVALGLRFPAALMTGALDRFGQPTGATLVLRAPGDIALLPVGAVPVPVFDLRPSVEVRFSRLLSAVLWVQYRRDYNRARLAFGTAGATVRGFADPNRLGYGAAARAAW
jgi:hypothetical protein